MQPPSFHEPGRRVHSLVRGHYAQHRPAQPQRSQAKRADEPARVQTQHERLQRRSGL